MAWGSGRMAVAFGAFGRSEAPQDPEQAGKQKPARSLTSFFGKLLGFSRPDSKPRRHSEPEPAYELDCLQGVLAPDVLKAAAQRGHDVGTGADQVLIRWGVIEEDIYLRYLARHTRLGFETFSSVTRKDCPLPDNMLAAAARHGIIPIRKNGEQSFVYAPRNYTARRISNLTMRFPVPPGRIMLTSSACLAEFLERHTGGALAHIAAEGLADHFPDLSAAPRPYRRSHLASFMRYAVRLSAFAIPVALAPEFVVETCGIILALWFLLFTSLRLAGSFAPRPRKPRLARLRDNELPVYTVIAALYREASSVAPLMRHIDALDYPREKLDIRIVIEPDDLKTRAALAKLGPMPHVTVMIAPHRGPKTKPKALNCALTFARGTFVTVYDAEDRPEPGQLRAALDAFRSHDDDVACVQASLCIDNTSDGWLPRMFTAEYAGQFDVFLQGFSTFEMPLPLGGSSNHFRTSVLREIGGWDPYNVTEDADLGFRLSRFGHRSVMFPSTTYEEAPSTFGGWLRQRSRWMKGWMQTWSVHMRSPLQLWRDTGARGFFTLNIIVGGNVLTALAHPILIGDIAIGAAVAAYTGDAHTFFQTQFASLHIATITAGYLSTVVVGVMGLARRRLLHESWVLLLTPLYWICLSIAAWRALFQLLREPYRWEKTEHGLARTSRIAGRKEPAPAKQ